MGTATGLRWVSAGLRVLIGAVFVYAGWMKAQDTGAFADGIASFRLLPLRLVNLFAVGLPIFEVLLGGLLLVGLLRRTAAFCVMLTSIVFLVALGSAWARGTTVDCGCFGASARKMSPPEARWLDLGRDLLLVGAAAVVYVDARGRQATGRPIPGHKPRA